MVKTKVVKEKVFGDCTGAIYIDLIHEASDTILNADVLHEFTMALYGALFRSGQWDSIIVCYNEHSIYVNDLNAALKDKNLKWFKIYYEHGCYFCDQIELIKEEKIKNEMLELRWIPVSERLPEKSLGVLVWCPTRKNIYCAYYEEKQWWIFGAYWEKVTEEVVAWMPLPKPYRGEKE